MRITMKMLEASVTRLNEITGQSQKSWVKDGDSYKAVIGNYHLDGAYGGYALHQIMNESGGVHTPLGSGYRPKRELFMLINAFAKGFVQAKESGAK